jgi:hypothetical protein
VLRIVEISVFDRFNGPFLTGRYDSRKIPWRLYAFSGGEVEAKRAKSSKKATREWGMRREGERESGRAGERESGREGERERGRNLGPSLPFSLSLCLSVSTSLLLYFSTSLCLPPPHYFVTPNCPRMKA